LPEATTPEVLGYRTVRRRHNTHVSRADSVFTDSPKFTVIKKPEQRDLHVDRQIADLVEEQRAAMGLLRKTQPIGVRRREGAAAVPEQLRFREPAWNPPQFTGTNGSRLRRLISWSWRAMSSFPVPVSPSSSTGASDGATRSIQASTAFMASLLATMSVAFWDCRSPVAGMRSFAAAPATASRILFGGNGSDR
jgi:hypothetical protein